MSNHQDVSPDRINARQRTERREEASLLLSRLLSQHHEDAQTINEMRKASLDRALMARDPHHVSDNLAGVPSVMSRYDLLRLRALLEQGL